MALRTFWLEIKNALYSIRTTVYHSTIRWQLAILKLSMKRWRPKSLFVVVAAARVPSEGAISQARYVYQAWMHAASALLRMRSCAQTKESFMRIPAILQGEARTRFLQGIAFGAVATMAIGFIWGGWVTGGTARTMTVMAESSGRMSVLVPICVAQFTAADGAVAKFKAASSYSRDDVVSEFVKTVASTSMDYSLAKACASGVEAELARMAAKSWALGSPRWGLSEMSDHRSGRLSYLGYCLLAVILFGCYVLLNGFQDDNSATMAPNLMLNRWRRAPLFFKNHAGGSAASLYFGPADSPASGASLVSMGTQAATELDGAASMIDIFDKQSVS
jgi:hypothetical protein